MERFIKNVAKNAVKRTVKAGIKKLLLILLPYLVPVLIFLLIFIILSILVALTYSAMIPGGYMTSYEMSPEDEAIKNKYLELTDTVWKGKPAWNAADCYEVPSEGIYYPSQNYPKLYALVDHYRRDYDLRLKWGIVHAVNLFWAYNYGKAEIPDSLREKVARDLHPYFYYKPSTITRITRCKTKDEDGNTVIKVTKETEDIYLLVEAYTIYGHYLFTYEWKTFTHKSDKCTTMVKKEVLVDRKQILSDKYFWIKGYLKNLYDLRGKPDEVEVARAWVMEAGEGFTEGKEWLDWMLENYDISEFVSAAMLPPDMVPVINGVAEKYGIPWWFLVAVIMQESSFNPDAAGGLLGISEQDWKAHAPELGFDPVADQGSLRAQLEVGAYILKKHLGNVDWGGNWKEQTLEALAYYGEFGVDGEIDEAVLERCRKEYASKIWEYAESFRSVFAKWPVPGHTVISSPYGHRIHPTKGTYSLHTGIDIPAPEGTPVVSASGGVVTAVGWYGDCGLRVTVRDGLHLYLYAHLSDTSVKKGQMIQPGQKIGAVGSTGESTGSHLHFGVKDLDRGCWIDPLDVLRVGG
ncbi:MAG: M23 family metallopeptidase [Peptococcaceae bacterium]|nr:M23 family metallopeptidase [Peptococcaceae bacterium]